MCMFTVAVACRYGPCMSSMRLERFERAKKFKLDPPQSIGKLLEVSHVLMSTAVCATIDICHVCVCACVSLPEYVYPGTHPGNKNCVQVFPELCGKSIWHGRVQQDLPW
jgi:hypothetical protein